MISVIIPALDESLALPRTLDALIAQPGDFEVIVVDGGSTDNTRDIAAAYSAVRLISAPRGRASQMNAGAAESRGSLLLFLHADTLLPPGGIRRLEELDAGRSTRLGGFRQRFSGDHLALRLISGLHNWRCRRSGVFYGDQAMFVSRGLFESIGGFPQQPILEDVSFCERALAAARPLLLDEYVITDSRKFEKMGIWRSFWRCVAIMTTYSLRMPIAGRRFFAPVR